ncbi:uncharacterized protein LOC129764211 [Toxorhynchites rutilus septentrionalis]|uniref:uncharacterized protein LOC129764211 n=1 Tax=Toxorhynchites rutilus septentrionalis TaxID=329112 RepID=UPI00247A6309|nr:uncharacterized protein LOC129764211 [Toxorhynchites rutilus septentrionalis]
MDSTGMDILIYPDYNKPFILTTDASDFAIGAVLSQGDVGKDKPIHFASRTLSVTEEKYSVPEKEMLAIFWSLNKSSNAKLKRWKAYLEEHDYEIVYKPDDSDDLYIKSTESPLNVFRHQVMIKKGPDKIVTENPFSGYTRINIDINDEKHFNCSKINGLLTDEITMGKIQEVYKKNFGQQKLLTIRFTQNILEDVREEDEQWNVIRTEHHRAHRGAQENKLQIFRKYFFPKLAQKIGDFIKNCRICHEFFLLFIIQTGTIQSEHGMTIKLQDIGRQPILVFHQGEARIRLDHKYYIHHFNLTTIKTQVKGLRIQFENFSKNQFTDLIIGKFNEIDFALRSIDPVRRHKRWNSLGTAWKFLAGSPDANDLKIINSSINNLISNNNEQIKINREINLQLKEAIFKTKKAIEVFNVGSAEMYCTKMLFHLNFLSEKIGLIIDTIMLAKLGIVNEQILSSKEIEILIADLARENVTVHTAVQATNYATTSVASNNLEIALIIKMPKLDPRTFSKVRLVPIIHENKRIHIPDQLFLFHNEEIYQISSIEPTVFDLHETHLENTTCIPNLLKGKLAICNFTSNPIEEEIFFLDEQHILVNTIKNFTLSLNCGITGRNLSGSYVIFFNNCQIYINNVLYSKRVKSLPGNPIQLPLDGIEVKKHQEILNISLEHLHNLHMETRKELDVIRLSTDSIQWPAWSIIGGAVSLPCMITGIAILFKFLSHRRATVNIQTIPNTIPSHVPPIDTQPNIRRLTIQEVIRMEPHL